MASINLIPIFLTGLVGSLHCLGMCGGIVGAFSVAPATPARKPFPLPVLAATQVAAHRSAQGLALPVLLHAAIRGLSYNSGRISSYMLAGAIAGGMGGVLVLGRLAPLQTAFYWLANLMLVVLGLYMMDAWRGLASLENAGQVLWRRVHPLTRRLLPLDSYAKFFAMGALWGWLPCGMVYSALLTAMLSGSAQSGATVMLAFGAGTLPALLTMGTISTQFRSRLQHPRLRQAAGALVLGFGLLGLARAASGHQAGWTDAFCISATSPPSVSYQSHPINQTP
ncbi:sulfite exporter TauE/SafE family protein [Undibacterium sp.]|uniref:sulfite exporter TauE/SafE family protein n=1 Tax=Undibacterium sp. TaxID=1914977 RepID=UPI00374DA140